MMMIAYKTPAILALKRGDTPAIRSIISSPPRGATTGSRRGRMVVVPERWQNRP
jgi:hypothetical protein